ncbi:MAG: RusA family crossover junction endodeoxyribonuclease [Peptostreptococcaceae bacterium]|nr:RusA family crossover junction endodeoxyribonuclease [Peptostreptococcaceae bacterium]MDY5738671.1 RusA family crossover junction endodeoxyribonuclease [Anaerovoracaceae bacterium]
MEIKIIIPGEPTAKGRPRVIKKGFAFTPQKTENYEAYVKALWIAKHGYTHITEPIQVELNFYHSIPKSFSKAKKQMAKDEVLRPTKRPDMDNCIKAITDALNEVAYADDSQIVGIVANRYYADMARVEIEIKTI